MAGKFVCYKKRNKNTNPATNILIYSGIQPARYASARMEGNLWEYTTNVSSDLRLTL